MGGTFQESLLGHHVVSDNQNGAHFGMAPIQQPGNEVMNEEAKPGKSHLSMDAENQNTDKPARE